MEYVVGAVIAGFFIYLFAVKRAVNRFNKLVLLPFDSWLKIYASSADPERTGISRAFLLQTLNLAEKLGALSQSDRMEVENGLKTEAPGRVVDQWLELALPNVIQVAGPKVMSDISARDAGLYMLVCVIGVNPQGDLRRFLEKRRL
ncbi:MAG: hypothetical protein Q8L91_19100 [Polaromonas sp.]|nr:hypothetical protein [Polaromonas sp.]